MGAEEFGRMWEDEPAGFRTFSPTVATTCEETLGGRTGHKQAAYESQKEGSPKTFPGPGQNWTAPFHLLNKNFLRI